MLAHFPGRETSKDGIIIADLASLCVESKASLIAVYVICEDTWKSATRENPWLPPTGEILKDIQRKTDHYRAAINRLSTPALPPPPPKAQQEQSDPYQGRKWAEFTEEDRTRFIDQHNSMMASIRPFWRRAFDVPEDAEIPKQNEEAEDANLTDEE